MRDGLRVFEEEKRQSIKFLRESWVGAQFLSRKLIFSAFKLLSLEFFAPTHPLRGLSPCARSISMKCQEQEGRRATFPKGLINTGFPMVLLCLALVFLVPFGLRYPLRVSKIILVVFFSTNRAFLASDSILVRQYLL